MITKVENTHIQTPQPASTDKSSTPLTKGFSQSDIDKTLENKAYSQMLKERTGHQLLLTAHRGMGPTSVFGSTFPNEYLPENSLESIKQAIMLGADAIEIDVFKSQDGVMMVTHDDEIWRNEYGATRDGSVLPAGETKDSYIVGKKTSEYLGNIHIGPNGEKLPTLQEVTDLVEQANVFLRENGHKPVVLNVELKDATAVDETVDFYSKQLSENPKLSMDDIIFCSFNHEALKKLKQAFSDNHKLQVLQQNFPERAITNIRVAPGIKTTMLFRDGDVNKDFSLAPNARYDDAKVAKIANLIKQNQFSGPDGILWDIREDFLKTAPAGELHASTSDFRQYQDDRDFAKVLLKLSEQATTFFKCDNIDDARKVLMETSILLNGVGIQMMCKPLADGGEAYYLFQPSSQNEENILETGARKPTPFSKLAIKA